MMTLGKDNFILDDNTIATGDSTKECAVINILSLTEECLGRPKIQSLLSRLSTAGLEVAA